MQTSWVGATADNDAQAHATSLRKGPPFIPRPESGSLTAHFFAVVPPQGFYSVHGDAALFIARDFYRTLAVVKYLGGPPPSGTPAPAAKPSSSSTPNTPASSSKGGLASVTLNRSLFEGVLRSLLLEGGQHSVELWEGAGANWSLSK